MKARNEVVAGDYKGKPVNGGANCVPFIMVKLFKLYRLNKDTVESFELITGESVSAAASGIARGAIGAALLGPVGMLAGMTAKNDGIYMIAIKFKDGKNSLIEVNSEVYRALVQTMF